jgi:hypothetical protein
MMQRRFHHALLALLVLLPALASARPQYDLDYHVTFLPEDGVAEVTIRTEPRDGRLVHADFRMDPARYTDVEGDGQITRADGRTLWVPPDQGGEFRYRFRIDHRRGSGGFDARITDDWTILRGDDLFPPATTRTTRGADSRARLSFTLPEGWNGADCQYRLNTAKTAYVVVNPERRFDRPTGWIIAGDLGVRREDIGDMHVSVAAPRGIDYPRLEILGYINATADDLAQLGDLPSKLLIVGADDPMWRGGLSAPRSLWMHADRPLISENGTSALLHELFHVVTGIRGADGEDWIAEGLAEYYSIELLNRAGLVSAARRDRTLEWMRQHGARIRSLRANHSSSRRTARAVALFAAMDRELQEAGPHSLDDVVRTLHGLGRRATVEDLREAVREAAGRDLPMLSTPLVN